MAKKLAPPIVLLTPYLLVAALYFPEFAAWFNTLVNGLWIEVALAIACAVWFFSLYTVQTSAWGEKAYALWNLILKLAHLPFYACMVLIILASPAYIFLMFWPIAMTVTATGLYGIRAITILQKRDQVGKYFVLVHMISCYLPGFDAVSALVIHNKVKTLSAVETDK